MALKFGLNVKRNPGSAASKPRRTLEDDDDLPNEPNIAEAAIEEVSTINNNASRKEERVAPSQKTRPLKVARAVPTEPPQLKAKSGGSFGPDLSSLQDAQDKAKHAEDLDASIFDYDSFHDAKSTVSAAREAAAKQDAVERKPKYINNLLDAAAKRKQDQLIAKEKLLQREREQEGDEFADKEKFVTGAYKQQQEEARRLEEEEKKKAEEEEKKKRAKGGGMQGFYRNMMDQSERQHQEAVEAAAQLDKSGGVQQAADRPEEKNDDEKAADLKARGINLNEEGQVTDKRQLLSAGLNVGATGKASDPHAADHLKASAKPGQNAFQGRKTADHAMRERQSRMLEEQLEASTKRAREEEDAERERRERAAKSQKSTEEVGDAKARYLARKVAREKEQAAG